MQKRKQFTYFMALKVAREDCEVGVCSAMQLLNEYGYKTPVYDWFTEEFWDAEVKHPDLDFDKLNLSARDADYKNIGIYDLMQKAYDALNK